MNIELVQENKLIRILIDDESWTIADAQLLGYKDGWRLASTWEEFPYVYMEFIISHV